MEKLRRIFLKVSQIPDQVSKVHVGAYAAQAAYFLMLCMIHSDHPSSFDAGAVYASDESGRYDSGYKGVSVVCRFDDHIHCQSGV